MSSYWLQKKEEHERLCEEKISAKLFKDAVFHAAKAADFAFALAEITGGEIGERYATDAEGWLEIAEQLKKRPDESTTKTQPGKPGGAAGGKGGLQEEEKPAGAEEWVITEKPKVRFADIAGMADAKKAIQEMVILPLQSPDKAAALGIKPGGGVLLYGPPGTGKTMFGKAIACEIDAPFFYASGAQIRSKWHGESEQRLRALIQMAKKEKLAVLFLDEVDGLLPRRSGQSVVDNRIVTQFLAEIGGFEESGNTLLLMAATNKPWDIDEAVFRTGRFDEKIYIGLPDLEARVGILKMNLKKTPLAPDFSVDDWAKRLEGFTGSDLKGIVERAKRAAFGRSIRENGDPVLTLADMEEALRTIPSSVTPKMIEEYQRFAKARFG